jgi:hypothetical protein
MLVLIEGSDGRIISVDTTKVLGVSAGSTFWIWKYTCIHMIDSEYFTTKLTVKEVTDLLNRAPA